MSGTAILVADGVNSLITATEAATLCGVKVCTITKWARTGRIAVAGMDESGRKLYVLRDIAEADRNARKLFPRP